MAWICGVPRSQARGGGGGGEGCSPRLSCGHNTRARREYHIRDLPVRCLQTADQVGALCPGLGIGALETRGREAGHACTAGWKRRGGEEMLQCIREDASASSVRALIAVGGWCPSVALDADVLSRRLSNNLDEPVREQFTERLSSESAIESLTFGRSTDC